MVTIGSLFTGYGGLDLAIEAVTGARTIWTADIDPGACRIIAHRFPAAPNLGDVSAVDWSTVERPSILSGGFPCQDVSPAGLRAGLAEGTRSGLWHEFARAIRELRPDLVVIENVRGLLTAKAARGAGAADVEPDPLFEHMNEGDDDAEADDRTWDDLGSGDEDMGPDDVPGPVLLRALGAVLGSLAELGHDAAWHGLPASDVGAPHERSRVFVLAWPTASDADRDGREGVGRIDTGRRDVDGRDRQDGDGHPGEPAPFGVQWGPYAAAVERWGAVLGRPAPAPTVPGKTGPRLNPWFVEWMMGLPRGWVCGVPGLSRNDMLKALGNGVVPQQAARALGILLGHMAAALARAA